MYTYVNKTKALRDELEQIKWYEKGEFLLSYYYGKSYAEHLADPIPVARAYAYKNMLENTKVHIYENDIIVGALCGAFTEPPPKADREYYEFYDKSYGRRGWFGGPSWHGTDHYASAYERILTMGVGGILEEIESSMKVHESEPKKIHFLLACRIEMEAFSNLIQRYADAVKDPFIKQVCQNIVLGVPKTFHEALQLLWFTNIAYRYKGCGCMALGRMDQYLFSIYENDIKNGVITKEEGQILLENLFMKIHETKYTFGGEDVINICIGGVTPDGEDAVNDLSYAILFAVKACQIPGPNLSARINKKNPDKFVIECLKSIGTGLGYPALMCDEVNVEALIRMGYEERDARNFCMVGCIENFIPGMQPPWADGRFNAPKALELLFNRGLDPMNGGKREGPDFGDPRSLVTMGEFMSALEKQLNSYAEKHILIPLTEAAKQNNENFVNPFMSCLTHDCIERGLDIWNGGSKYPSAYGACGMGIGTFADSLAAIEKCVYIDKSVTIDELISAVNSNFKGFERVRDLLLSAPKYGNDDDFVDKYAVWYVEFLTKTFDKFRFIDGGRVYVLMAANISNIYAGEECGALPCGRLSGEPLSDAASPTYGVDINGPTYTLNSLSKPDYTRVAGGSVVNQKFSPSAFEGEENLKRLCALVRVYFAKGGQQVQVNSVSREILQDAMANPEKYKNLVVRVSGFSAYYTQLAKEVQLDILSRTEHTAL